MAVSNDRASRWWGFALSAIGVLVLGIAVVIAIGIARDPSGSYDSWAGETVNGPEAGFEWFSDGTTVEFMDTSTTGDVEIEQWIWSLGNGEETRELNPVFGFEPGEFTVSLDVVDANGLTSTAEASVSVEPGSATSGTGQIGLTDLADKVVTTVEDAAKAGLVVLLVIAMLVVLTMVGGRLVRHGTRMLRPVPDRIAVKLRPKRLELDLRRHEELNIPMMADAPEVAETAEVEPVEVGV
ncbi:MAG: PKD domain-containing protein [Acidimicrobiia bacterium]|nr:PKD domain-containing protein [Acidimicrobiia bacterium]NNF64172.1 PKD domain-containing protein [Acidimicrobiia bacterium]